MHLRSATRRQNTPSALARRTRILETRRTNLANKIRELETDLRQQRGALDALTIEVDHALARREDEGARYQRLIDEQDRLRYAILTNFNQSDLGMEYSKLKRWWYEHVYNEDENTEDANYYDNRKARFDQVSALFDELMDSGFASINAEREQVQQAYRIANERYHTLYQQQQYIIGVINNLERKLEQALIRDRALNQARGKKQRRFTYKRGKYTRKRR
jgi:chromosome segregation ATPase